MRDPRFKFPFGDISAASWQSDPAQSDAVIATDTLVFSSSSAVTPSDTAGISTSASTEGLNMIGFITGETSSGGLMAQSYASWGGDDPATYSTNFGIAANWGAGATVTYAFNPASNYTAAEQAAYVTALKLWSAVANISFSVTSNYSFAKIQFTRTSDGQANTNTNYTLPNPRTRPGHLQTASVGIDTSIASFADPTSFTSFGGYAKEVVQHEIGHALGLGHPGAYNGTTPTSGQILYATTDTRQYTVMSYNDPAGDPYNGNHLTTPGQYDILALQRIYGAPTASIFSGGQIFGFNTNTSIDQFDFTKNTTPVVTLYDTGTGNTLDVSGFTQSATIDLNPGAFSSVAGLRNNIGIDFTTRIDTVITGAGDDSIAVNNNADIIDGGGGNDIVTFNATSSAAALSRTGTTVTATIGTVTYTLRNIETLSFTNATIDASTVACFIAGTMIATTAGETPIESLRAGDLIRLDNGRLAPVTWIGRRSVHIEPGAEPLCIAPHSFGPNLPHAALTLSPDHAVFAGGVLIPVRCLENRRSVRRDERPHVTYFHVALDTHEILRANGLPVESWLDEGCRDGFDNPKSAPPVRLMSPAAAFRTQGLEVERVRLTLLTMEDAT
jgi:serralysin